MLVCRIKLPSDVRWLLRCFCFDPPHPGCATLLLASRTFNGTVPVASVSTGYRHLAFVSTDGRLFTHGSNCMGQCGIRADMYPCTTEPVVSMLGTTAVTCGLDFTVAISKTMVWFCGAYNYHPSSRSFNPCVSIADHWVPFSLHCPPITAKAYAGSAVRLRWPHIEMVLPIRGHGNKLPAGLVWAGRRYSGVLCGPSPRWRVQALEALVPRCKACGHSLSGRAIVACPCCLMHIDCAGICFSKSGMCPCGHALGPLRQP